MGNTHQKAFNLFSISEAFSFKQYIYIYNSYFISILYPDGVKKKKLRWYKCKQKKKNYPTWYPGKNSIKKENIKNMRIIWKKNQPIARVFPKDENTKRIP